MKIEEAAEMLAAASPRPWSHRLEPRGAEPGVYKVGNAGHDIAVIANTVFEDEQEANATLLGLSPVTLAALMLAAEALENDGHTGFGKWCHLFGTPSRTTLAKNCEGCVALTAWEAL